MLSLLLIFCIFDNFDEKSDLYKIAEIDYSASTYEIQQFFSEYMSDLGDKSEDKINALKILNSTNLRRLYDLYGIEGLKNEQKYRGIFKPLSIKREVKLLDFYYGCNFTFIFTRERVCKCPHPGFMCEFCNGSITVEEEIPLYIELKKGAADPFIFNFPNLTDSTDELEPSNLKVVMMSKSGLSLRREFNNIHIIVNNSLSDLKPGDSISYTYIDGREHSIVLEEVKPEIVLKGKGMPFEGTDKYGDLILHIINRNDILNSFGDPLEL